MEDLTCEINGIKYLLFEFTITRNSEEKIGKRIDRHDGIIQSCVVVDGGFFGTTHANCKVLIPEKNVIAWNADEN